MLGVVGEEGCRFGAAASGWYVQLLSSPRNWLKNRNLAVASQGRSVEENVSPTKVSPWRGLSNEVPLSPQLPEIAEIQGRQGFRGDIINPGYQVKKTHPFFAQLGLFSQSSF